MGLLDLFVVASTPVLKILFITALGSILALERINILGDNARKQVNNIVFYVFNPALVGSNLAKTITYESVASLWFMPVNILITFIVGSALGWLIIKVTRAPPHLKGLILGTCSAGNLGHLPLVIIPAVCKEKGSPFGAPDTCHTYGMAYASLSMAIGAIYMWTYVYNIVRVSTSKLAEVSSIEESTVKGKSSRDSSRPIEGDCTEALLPPKDCSSTDHTNEFSLPCTKSNKREKAPISDKIMHHLRTFSDKIGTKALFAPSTIGAVVGFAIGIISPVRKLLIGTEAPLHVVQDSVLLIGDAAIPTVTLIVGGNLLKGLKGSGVRLSIIFGVVGVRYIVMPLVGFITVKAAIHFGLVHSDPLYQFVLLLQFALPPAMNIGTITQLFGAGESECSVILLWAYSLASISLTLWSTFFMWLVA